MAGGCDEVTRIALSSRLLATDLHALSASIALFTPIALSATGVLPPAPPSDPSAPSEAAPSPR